MALKALVVPGHGALGVGPQQAPIKAVSPDSGRSQIASRLSKGFEDNQTLTKHAAAQRWIEAVTNWGKIGRWMFHVCRNPQTLEQELHYLLRQMTNAA